MKPYLPPDEFQVPDPPRDLSRKDRARRLAVDAIEAAGDRCLANDLRRARLRGDGSAPKRNGVPFAPPGFRLVWPGVIGNRNDSRLMDHVTESRIVETS